MPAEGGAKTGGRGTIAGGVKDFIANERAAAAVERSLQREHRPQTYLFVGPERVGRATLACRLAQALNCTGGPSPCGECGACRRIAGGIHADVQTVTLEVSSEAPQRKAISVEQVRDIERSVALSPFEGRTRVVIIDPADEMTVTAQNAFLKTLEEPPPHVVFVLISGQEERLLETVRSRCQRIGFRLAPVAAIEAALRRRGVGEQTAVLLARLARGRPGWALAMAQDPSLLERRRQGLELARSLTSMSLAKRMDLAERLSDDFKRDRETVLALLREWQGWWRDLLLVQSGAEVGVANVDAADGLREDAAVCQPAAVQAFLQALGDTRQYLQENVQSRLALEALLLAAPGYKLARMEQAPQPRSA